MMPKTLILIEKLIYKEIKTFYKKEQKWMNIQKWSMKIKKRVC